MPLDAYKNFAESTLASGINSAATSLAVTSGHGTRFPAVAFNATIWNSTDYASAAAAFRGGAAEIVRVTAISTDTFTITRAQEGTSAVNLNTGGKTYTIGAYLTAKFQSEITRTPFSISSSSGTLSTDASLGIIFSSTLTENITLANPSNLSDGATITWRLRQNGTGGYTVSLGSKFRIPNGATTPLGWNVDANGVSIFSAIYNSTDDKLDVVSLLTYAP